MTKNGDEDDRVSVRREGGKNLHGRHEDIEQPLNPRIVDGLNNLYDGIVNDPIPDKIANILDQLREKERSLKSEKAGPTGAEKGKGGLDDAD